ncbi:hypothetical protein C4569_00150 [Candidatus Parcubacteria bacterium]|nr:MAG: hypothetical protein C4569_00150 [Candidatus Parcubacteria bacterium]
MKKKAAKIFCLMALFLLTACTGLKKQPPPPTSGVYRSVDEGVTWTRRNTFVSPQGVGSLSTVSVNKIIMDPNDFKALYLLGNNEGLLYSYDAGESWMQAQQFRGGTILSLAVDPHDKCTIYLSFGNQVYKSSDCSRNYKSVYIDSRKTSVTAVALDEFNFGVIYIGTETGEIIKSSDSGLSWTTVARLGSKIEKILIYPKDTRVIYVPTQKKGIYKSNDSGVNWEEINEGLKQYSGSREFKDLIFVPSQDNSMILLSRYGLLKTTDGGTNWEAVELITPPLSADIRAVAVSPLNSEKIYYGTGSTFYKTEDGGQNWITSKLPTGSPASILIINPEEPNILYLGFKSIKQ